jgi:hypothetical protein
MKTLGRLLLALGLAACAAPVGPGPAPAAAPAVSWADDLTPIGPADWDCARAAHLLERAGFGGTPEEVDRLARMTPAQAVDYLVDYEKLDDSKLPAFEPSGIYPHGHKWAPLQDVFVSGLLTDRAYGIKASRPGRLTFQPAVNEFYTLLTSERLEMRRASQWWAERMLLTPRPLQEKLALFWHGHFATSQEKVLNYELLLAQVATLRRHANGNFRTLLIAVAQDPAMLVWLDNKDNVKGRPNENFAREVMELFTMGEGQGYTEADVRELARAFTGWTMKKPRTVKDDPRFKDDKKLHDGGVKVFLDHKGKLDGYAAIDVILKQPATPRFLTRKLYRFFVREEMSPAVNAKLAKLLVESKYELRPLLKAIFLSRDFYSGPSVCTQIKSPTHFLVSTYRKLGLRSVPGVPDCTETAEALGQVLFFPPNVAGWPGGRAWINPATLLARGNFANALLFPDLASFVPPDKVVVEGYRRIPLDFPEHNIVPHVWDAKARKMTPVSVGQYERYLARLGGNTGKAMMPPPAMMKKEMGKPPRSKMTELAHAETHNLAVGVYVGQVEARNRVRPVPRTAAELDLVGMLRRAKVDSVEGAVDHFGRRLLSVPLHPERRAAVVRFLRDELGGPRIDYRARGLDLALRRTVHLILSAPEYQLG